MFRHIARFSIILATLWLGSCGANLDPHPQAQQPTRPDGTPWIVRYSSLPDDPKSLDPQYAYEQTSHRVLECIYDGLLEYHPLKTDPYELRPCMLAAMPERTNEADGKVTLTCRLKPNIHFHDDPCFPGPGGKGREVVAEDVHFTFLRMADPKVECPISAMLSENIIGFADVMKATEKANGLNYKTQRIPGIEVVDQYTFRIHLLKPYPQMRYWMAMQFCSPVPHEALEYYDGKIHDGMLHDSFRNHPVGNGPFRFVKWEHNERVTLVRNPDYHTTTFPEDGIPPEKEALLRPLAGKQLPFVDELQIRVMRELYSTWLLTKQGYLDRMAISKDSFGNVMSPGGKEISPSLKKMGFSTQFELELSTFYFVLNFKDPILGSNKKLRQALACAFDAKSQSEIFYNGTRPIAEQLVPPGIFGHEKDRHNPWAYNVGKAKQLLAEAGYPGGKDPRTGQPLELSMDVDADSSELRKQVGWERDLFDAIGVKVRIVENTFASLMRKEIQGDFQIASGSGWGADYPDPENFFFLFYSKNFPPSGRNDCRYNNPEYDRLYEKMASMDDTPERLAICHQLMDMLSDDCPIIFCFHKGDFVLYPPWAPPTHANMMWEGGLKFITVDPAVRDQKRREWNGPLLWPLWLLGGLAALGIAYAIRLNRNRNA